MNGQNEPKLRTTAAGVASAVIMLFAAAIYFSIDQPPASRELATTAGAGSVASHPQHQTKQEQSSNKPVGPSAVMLRYMEDDDTLSDDEVRVIEETLKRVDEILKEVERSNATIMLHQTWGNAEGVVVQITPPTTEQLEPVHALISDNLKNLGKRTIAQEVFHRRVGDAVRIFTDYPKPIKAVSLIRTAVEGKPPILIRLFVDNIEAVLPKSDGKFTIPPGSRAKIDEEWGQGNSWGAKRYKYLLEVDR